MSMSARKRRTRREVNRIFQKKRRAAWRQALHGGHARMVRGRRWSDRSETTEPV